MSTNRVVIVGRLVRSPESRTTSTGKNVCSFTVAVDKRIKPQDGSPTADFFSCTAWGQTAEFVTTYLTKGRLIAVDGRLQSRKYQASDGSNREVVEIVAESVHGLDRPKDDDGERPAPKTAPAPTEDEYDPFGDE